MAKKISLEKETKDIKSHNREEGLDSVHSDAQTLIEDDYVGEEFNPIVIKDTPLSKKSQNNIEEAGDESDSNVVDEPPLSQKSEDYNEEAVKDIVKESRKGKFKGGL